MEPELLGTRGELWFVAQSVLLALLIFTPDKIGGLAEGVGIVGLCTGLAVITIASNDLGKSLSPFPEPRRSNELTRTGMYRCDPCFFSYGRSRPVSGTDLPAVLLPPSPRCSYVRHPMYSGILTSALGLSIFTASPAKVLITIVLMVILDRKAGARDPPLAAAPCPEVPICHAPSPELYQ